MRENWSHSCNSLAAVNEYLGGFKVRGEGIYKCTKSDNYMMISCQHYALQNSRGGVEFHDRWTITSYDKDPRAEFARLSKLPMIEYSEDSQ